MYSMQRGYGYVGFGQGLTPVSSGTTSGGTQVLGGSGGTQQSFGLTMPGPETWGTNPVAVALAQIGGAVVQKPVGQEDAFVSAAIQAMVQTGQVIAGNPDASMNACWTCAYVYAYYAAQQLIASGAQVQGSKLLGGQLLGGIVGVGGGLQDLLGGAPGQASVSSLTHGMYDRLRADTYAMGYYGGCVLNKVKGMNCAGQYPIKAGRVITGTVSGNVITSPRSTVKIPVPGAAAPAATSHTTLLLGGLAVAGVAAYLAFA